VAWNPSWNRAQCRGPALTTNLATAGEGADTEKTRSETGKTCTTDGDSQRKKERMLDIVAEEKQGEEKGGVTQSSPATQGILGGDEMVEEKRERRKAWKELPGT
jgi:hypothetical protein